MRLNPVFLSELKVNLKSGLSRIYKDVQVDSEGRLNVFIDDDDESLQRRNFVSKTDEKFVRTYNEVSEDDRRLKTKPDMQWKFADLKIKEYDDESRFSTTGHEEATSSRQKSFQPSG